MSDLLNQLRLYEDPNDEQEDLQAPPEQAATGGTAFAPDSLLQQLRDLPPAPSVFNQRTGDAERQRASGGRNTGSTSFDPVTPTPIQQFMTTLPEDRDFTKDERYLEMLDIMQGRTEFRQANPANPILDLANPGRYAKLTRFGRLRRELSRDYDYEQDLIHASVFSSLEQQSRFDPGQNFAWGGQSVRTIAQVAKPFQYAQDVSFALMDDVNDINAGEQTGLDTTRRVIGRTAMYNPFDNRMPEREVTGADLVRNFVENAPGGGATKRALFSSPLAQELGLESSGDIGDLKADDLPDAFYNVMGFVVDVGVDPLLAGSYVRGLGHTLQAAGATQTAAKARRVGDAIELAMSPAGVAGAAKQLIPKAVRRRVDATMGDWFNSLLQIEVKFPEGLGSRGGEITTVGRMGLVEGRNPLRRTQNEFTGGAGQAPEIRQAIIAGEFHAEEVMGKVQQSFEGIKQAVGEPIARGWVENMFAATGLYEQAAKRARKFPQAFQELMFSKAWDTGDSVGILRREGALEKLDDVFTRSTDPSVVAPTVRAELEGIRQSFLRGNQANPSSAQHPLNALNDAPDVVNVQSLVERDALKTIRSEAGLLGVDPDVAEKAFQEIVDLSLAADVAMGFNATLYTPVKQAMFKRVLELGGGLDDAGTLWRELLSNAGALDTSTAGVANLQKLASRAQHELDTVLEALKKAPSDPALMAQEASAKANLLRAQNNVATASGGVLERTTLGTEPLSNLFGKKITKVRDLFDGTELAAVLPLDSFFSGLSQGHLRRSFSVFQGRNSVEALAKNLTNRNFQNPQLLPVRVLSHKPKLTGKGNKGKFGPSALEQVRTYAQQAGKPHIEQGADIIEHYIEKVSPFAKDSRGVAVRQDTLLKYMVQRGMSPREAEDAMGKVITQMNPHLRGQYSSLKKYIHKMEDGNRGGRIGTGFQERQELVDQMLDVLGQVDNPALAIAEQAVAQKGPIAKSQALADIWAFVTDKHPGLIKPYREQLTPGWRAIEDTEMNRSIYGPFADKIVDQRLYRELHNLMETGTPSQVGQAVGQLRSIISAGWLASTKTTSLNVLGGFVTAALQGDNPLILARYMLKTAKEWHKEGANYQTVREVGRLLMTGLHSQDIGQLARMGKLKETGLGANSFGDAVGQIAEGILTFPAGQTGGRNKLGRAWNAISGSLGLRGFEYTEDLFKLARYNMGREFLGESIEEAAEKARWLVFDYSSTPVAVDFARDTGMALFPGYPYFIVGRTIDAMLHRPGSFAAIDRIPDAIWDMNFNTETKEEEESLKYLLWRSLGDYQRDGRVAPFVRGGPNGLQFGMFPIGDAIPNPGRSPLIDQIGRLGIGTGLADAAYALGTGGKTAFAAQFGRTTAFEPAKATEHFDEGLAWVDQSRQMAEFLWDSYAPGFAKQVITFGDPDGESRRGIIPLIQEAIKPAPELGDTAYSMSELGDHKADRSFGMELASTLVRSGQVVDMEPIINSLFKQRANEERELSESLNVIAAKSNKHYNKMADYASQGMDAEAQRELEQAQYWDERKMRLNLAFQEEWTPFMQLYGDYLAKLQTMPEDEPESIQPSPLLDQLRNFEAP